MIKQWNENQNKCWIDQLHLVWFDHITSNLSIHPCGLKSPSGTLGNRKNDVMKNLLFTPFHNFLLQLCTDPVTLFVWVLFIIMLNRFFYWLKKLQSVVKWLDKKGTLLFLSQAEFQVPLISFELMKKRHSYFFNQKMQTKFFGLGSSKLVSTYHKS